MSTSQIDWKRIADRFQQVMWTMLNEEGRHHDATFYADALQRTLGYVAAGEPGTSGRALPYEHLDHGQGLTTEAQAKHVTDTVAYFDQVNREKAEQQVKEMREEVRRVYREAAKDLANRIRERCNERTVPSRFRREGVAWAADMIDPTVPKDQYGNLRAATSAEAVDAR
jgi:hypothetical protein